MCFSPEASFGAAAGLTVIGAISYKKAEKTDLRLLALVPIFFGFQQFTEGIVWLTNMYDGWASLKSLSTNVFMFFAWIVWPLFVPWLLYVQEKKKTRKKILLGLVIMGVFVASVLTYILIGIGVEGEIQDCSIAYNFDFKHDFQIYFVLMYQSVTILPSLISSLGKIWLMGVANFAMSMFSRIYYKDHIISVWCFLAALSSAVVLYVIVDQMKKNKQHRL